MNLGITKIFLFILFTTFSTIGLCQQGSYGAFGWCQGDNNVNCPNWPPSIGNNKNAAFLYFMPLSGGRFKQCNGTLIRNRGDENHQNQYFITAKHCLDGIDLSQNFYFAFNYQSPTCDDNNVPNEFDINGTKRTGVRYRFQSPIELIVQKNETDMALLRIINPIPPHYKVYYTGWSSNLLQGIEFPFHDIHHPRGDIKNS